LFASVGYFAKTTYHMPSLEDSKRDELDLNIGYWILQGDGGRLGLTLGYKQIKQSFQADGWNAKVKVLPTIGFASSANITGPWNLYANGAWGPAKETATSWVGPDFSAKAITHRRGWDRVRFRALSSCHNRFQTPGS